MLIRALFTKGGEPALGLTPTILIINLQTSVIVINNMPMVEVGLGAYRYDFILFDSNYDYHILCNAHNSTLDAKGISYGSNELFTQNFVQNIADTVSERLNERFTGFGE